MQSSCDSIMAPMLRAGIHLKKRGEPRWRIIRKIGHGTFSEIYSARDVKKCRDVAIKVASRVSGAVRTLNHEQKILKELQGCPHVCKWYYFGEDGEHTFLVMEILRGGSLSKVRKKGRSARLAGLVGLEMLKCIKAVHSLGFVHRDIKPSNFVVARRNKEHPFQCRILDFGISRKHLIDGEVRPARECTFRGSAMYASLNAHEDKDLGRRDDLWSLFCVVVDLCEGLPWSKESERLSKDRAYVMKKGFFGNDNHPLFRKQPELLRFKRYLESLEYSSEPKYSLLEDVLQNLVPDEKINKVVEVLEVSDNGDDVEIFLIENQGKVEGAKARKLASPKELHNIKNCEARGPVTNMTVVKRKPSKNVYTSERGKRLRVEAHRYLASLEAKESKENERRELENELKDVIDLTSEYSHAKPSSSSRGMSGSERRRSTSFRDDAGNHHWSLGHQRNDHTDFVLSRHATKR